MKVDALIVGIQSHRSPEAKATIWVGLKSQFTVGRERGNGRAIGDPERCRARVGAGRSRSLLYAGWASGILENRALWSLSPQPPQQLGVDPPNADSDPVRDHHYWRRSPHC